MKPRFVIAMLLVFALSLPASMLAQGSKAENQVRAVIGELQKANLKGGPEVVPIFDKYLADDFVRVLPNGVVHTKAEILDGFRTGKIKVESSELSDMKIHVYGNTAVATAILHSRATVIGAAVTSPSRWTRVFVKRRGVWQCVLYQNTKLPEAA